ncbi:hypothetical protein Skr01_60500 [Sphaerisporangium krabiense]|nr:hypothetical protein Skr01_60500 [Sphaerisporangium krabiense]
MRVPETRTRHARPRTGVTRTPLNMVALRNRNVEDAVERAPPPFLTVATTRHRPAGYQRLSPTGGSNRHSSQPGPAAPATGAPVRAAREGRATTGGRVARLPRAADRFPRVTEPVPRAGERFARAVERFPRAVERFPRAGGRFAAPRRAGSTRKVTPFRPEAPRATTSTTRRTTPRGRATGLLGRIRTDRMAGPPGARAGPAARPPRDEGGGASAVAAGASARTASPTSPATEDVSRRLMVMRWRLGTGR